MKTALLIVERDFLSHHVGVRRVVLNYWRHLERQGYAVTLAAPIDGRLSVGKGVDIAAIEKRAARAGTDAPDWVTGQEGLGRRRVDLGSLLPSQGVRWTAASASPDDFDVSVVTNPWLCAHGLPPGRITAAIVYDMVPNLVASGALNLGTPMDIYAFARDHDAGYRLYLERAQSILCISENSRTDFIRFYALDEDAATKVRTVIPYEIDPDLRIRALPRAAGERPRVLLVNVLDPRKNFKGAQTALTLARNQIAFDIDVVGRERMGLKPVLTFLKDLSALGANVRWYRQASDACLHRLYADADVLLFPSYYEGLGLPILEAQSQGVPAVAANTSSCVEINMNAGLGVDPLAPEVIAQKIVGVLDGSIPHVAGRPLRDRLGAYLADRNRLPDWDRVRTPASDG